MPLAQGVHALHAAHVLARESLVAAMQPQMATCDWGAVRKAQDGLPFPAMRANALTRLHLPLYMGLVTVPEVRILTVSQWVSCTVEYGLGTTSSIYKRIECI